MKYPCGWPDKHWPDRPRVCPCGWIFPDRVIIDMPDAHTRIKIKQSVTRRERLEDDTPLFRESLPRTIKRERL